MPKYNLGSKSDMRKFQRDLEKNVMSQARSAAQKMTFDIDCPNCSRSYSAQVGLNTCPHCGSQTDVDLKVDF